MNEPKQPSELALRIAKRLYPNGLPNVSYCWSDPDKNELAKQIDRGFKALQIDEELNRPTESQVLGFVVEDAGDPSVGIPSLHEEVSVTLKHGGHCAGVIEALREGLSEVLENALCECGGGVMDAAKYAEDRRKEDAVYANMTEDEKESL